MKLKKHKSKLIVGLKYLFFSLCCLIVYGFYLWIFQPEVFYNPPDGITFKFIAIFYVGLLIIIISVYVLNYKISAYNLEIGEEMKGFKLIDYIVIYFLISLAMMSFHTFFYLNVNDNVLEKYGNSLNVYYSLYILVGIILIEKIIIKGKNRNRKRRFIKDNEKEINIIADLIKQNLGEPLFDFRVTHDCVDYCRKIKRFINEDGDWDKYYYYSKSYKLKEELPFRLLRDALRMGIQDKFRYN